jgi:hypothetical protein
MNLKEPLTRRLKGRCRSCRQKIAHGNSCVAPLEDIGSHGLSPQNVAQDFESSMSTAPTPTSSKQGKGKKEKRRSSQTQQNERLKIIVRRLPPNLPEDLFWQSVLPWVTEETTIWKIFYPGKLRKK